MTDLTKKSSTGSEDQSIHAAREDEKGGMGGMLAADLGNREHLSAIFDNPLANVDDNQLMLDVEEFCQRYDLIDQLENMKKGAKVSKRPHQVADADYLTQDEKDVLLREKTHKWDHPWMLYWLCTMCSLAAATQGMDETANNGALPIYSEILRLTPERFGSQSKTDNIQGLVVSAPYLACAVLGCWLTEPLNKIFARRGTIFISSLIAALASIWEAVVQSWPNLFVARFVLGLGIGTKSATVPVYAAECAPAPIRGALVMQWQVWTAFGIMLGNIIGVAFGGLEPNLAWRLILGSTVVLPLFVCAQVYYCPESPRWLIQNNQHKKAFRSFQKLRTTDLQACRDLYYTHVGVEIENRINAGKNFFTKFWELFSVPRNRRATWQFCGVNIIAYYSTQIFIDGGYSLNSALLASMGTGILNWTFALPAFLTIDKFGRRPLLIFTFPFLAIFLLWIGMSFFIDPPPPGETASKSVPRTAMLTTGMYLFECFYSPGMGPVPFSYSAEAFPTHVRDVGMSWATATTWCFNFILAFTFPRLRSAFTNQGAFGWYAAWCIILWILVIMFMPETKELTLEELDQVFSVPTWKHTSYQMKNIRWHFRRYVLRQRDLEPLPPLYQGVEKFNKS
ncbi:MAG: hypothetical protein Q9216_007145 [Gyalolechia sp. 2 TL-2023]